LRPEEVLKSQRERILGAMFACLGEMGCEKTTVADLEAASGVSRRSFYRHFAGTQDCLSALARALIEEGTRRLTGDPRSEVEASIEERAVAFARLVVEEPRAARICLLDCHAAGRMGSAALERAEKEWAEAITGSWARSQSRGELPPESSAILVGALVETARHCLQTGRLEELGALTARIADLALAYQPPPEPIRRVQPARAWTETPAAGDHPGRAVHALGELCAEVGYSEVSAAAVIERAGMSPRTFYANFAGKEEVLLEAIERAGAGLLAAALPAFRRNTSWGRGVRAAIGAALGFLASRPLLARLLMVEVYAAGPRALSARDGALRAVETVVDQGATLASPPSHSIAPWVLAEGFYGLARRLVAEQGAESLAALAPLLSYLALQPFLGTGAACSAANGTAESPRGGDEETLGLVRQMSTDVFMKEIAYLLTQGAATLEEIAQKVGIPRAAAEKRVDELVRFDLVQAMTEKGGSTRYGTNLREMSEEEWLGLTPAERERISSRIGSMIATEVELAFEAGSFDGRPDRHLSRVDLRLDPRGWDEVLEIQDQALHAILEVKAKVEKRLAQRGERGASARAVQAFFEMPEP
jgi:AcrR family transcriptional regulator